MTTAKKKILILDDDVKMLRMLDDQFTFAGFQCYPQTNGYAALDKVKEIDPDIILSDLLMPIMNGFEFRKKILEQSETKNTPFVFLTSHENESSNLKAFFLEAADYIQKTSSMQLIIKKVENILSTYENQKFQIINDIKNAVKDIQTNNEFSKINNQSGYQILHFNTSHNGIPGGDYIDFIDLDENGTMIVLADIMGKEWPAWFISFAFVSYFRSTIRTELLHNSNPDPSIVLAKVNNTMVKDKNLSGIISSITLLKIPKVSGNVILSGAGDLPIYHRNKLGEVFEYHNTGIMLGIKENAVYENILINLNNDESLLIYTDGLTESVNSNEEQYGYSRLRNYFKSKGGEKAFINLLEEEINIYTENKFNDDITAMIIKKTEDAK